MGKVPTKTLATQATHCFAAVLAYPKSEVLKLHSSAASVIFASTPNAVPWA